ncbi:response regulator transcription factor [Fervidibacter sacchari]|uniref:DNA-binding NarL/FixJ family response regulator n=1 Tax=Candidatus Fervidibacter sacchari TaxID=1448929 RepID=A0ABT2ENI0_9BACT|nr:response regulator transcription factor [Candidatus Fervidibacter sacchari]MCS3918475.1 DNA-binding NarL/FixJ family response regulator [Candidatus Fervidibacter sacchari]WKU17756.1 response regulator transcription factor [Candidatus Fervidibacter sacchari]
MGKKNRTNETEGISVIICDKQPLFRLGLKLVLQQGNFRVIGEANDADELMASLALSVPEILVLDMFIARLENFGLLRQIRAKYPNIKVMLVVPRSIHPIELLSAIQSGAIGCILRDSSPDLIIRALHSVTSGLPWIQRELTEHILQGFNTFPISEEPIRALTEREKQILIMLAKGLSNKEIAKQMGLSLQTVKTHVSHILQKLKVRSRAEAARYAFILLKSSFDGQKLALSGKRR